MRFTVANRSGAAAGCVLVLCAVVFGAACSAPPVKVVVPTSTPPATPGTSAPDEPGTSVVQRNWPMFGGTNQRNMVNTVEKGMPTEWSVEEGKEKNVKWSAKVGEIAYGGPVIAGGKVFVGTNNQKPRDPQIKGDKGVLMCFRESDGKFLWQAVHDKLEGGSNVDNPQQGIASVPVVEADRVYYVSNRCELVCADTAGEPGTEKAKFLWTFDMMKELHVHPGGPGGGLANCSPLILDDLIFVCTSNGLDEKGKVVAPDAPSFIAVNKKTGKLVWKDSSPGDKIMEGQWASPAAAEVNGQWQVIFPGGDGWLYAFEARTGTLLWKFDCNPKAAKAFGSRPDDRNYLVATPVVYDNKVYICVGQEPSKGTGVGHMWCIDPTKKPANKDKDLSPVEDNFDPKAAVNKDSGLVWHYGGFIVPRPKRGRDWIFGRTIAAVAVHDGLVYAVDFDGFLYCMDAKTGAKVWIEDFKDSTWCAPNFIDGKIYIGTENGEVLIYAAGKEPKQIGKVNMESPVQTPLVAVNGVLFINNGIKLFAIATKK